MLFGTDGSRQTRQQMARRQTPLCVSILFVCSDNFVCSRSPLAERNENQKNKPTIKHSYLVITGIVDIAGSNTPGAQGPAIFVGWQCHCILVSPTRREADAPATAIIHSEIPERPGAAASVLRATVVPSTRRGPSDRDGDGAADRSRSPRGLRSRL